MATHYEISMAEIIIEKADAGWWVKKRERLALLKAVNRIRALYAVDPLEGWQPQPATS